jgi:hypothetical protein
MQAGPHELSIVILPGQHAYLSLTLWVVCRIGNGFSPVRFRDLRP